MWGFILVIFSAIFWQFKENLQGTVSLIFSSLFLIKGFFLIFYPKRKIKKGIENWKKLPNEIKKIEGVIYIAISFLIITIIV